MIGESHKVSGREPYVRCKMIDNGVVLCATEK